MTLPQPKIKAESRIADWKADFGLAQPVSTRKPQYIQFDCGWDPEVWTSRIINQISIPSGVELWGEGEEDLRGLDRETFSLSSEQRLRF